MNDWLNELAPAKINVCLFLGPARANDGRHELLTVFQPVTLYDRVALAPAALGSRHDMVECRGVEGENLAATALHAFRERAGWRGPAVHLRIAKRIPVAAGMAGGSADAGAALRLAARASGLGDDALLYEVARGLGADVPAQVRPARWLATGAGERLSPLADPAPYGVLVLPSRARLSTADVYRTADRLGLPRSESELSELRREVAPHAHDLPDDLVVNDLQPAALALCPEIEEALDVALELGAAHALVCGSGPTVIGLFAEVGGARAAAVALGGRVPRPFAVQPWRARGAGDAP